MVGNVCGNMAEGRAPAVIVTSSWARGKSQDVSEPQFPLPVEHMEGQYDLQWRGQAMECSGAEGRILSQQHSRCTGYFTRSAPCWMLLLGASPKIPW